MAEILKEWLNERLQQPIKWEAEEFGELMKNGYVVAGVLLSYHVINEEQYFLVRASNMSADMNNNWKFLSEWLRDVDVFLSDGDISNIKDGKGSTLLRLFYQLFLHLDKRDRTNFIKRERKMVSNLVEKIGNRFTVDKVPEEPIPFVDDLSRPLLNEKHFIEWQKKKSEEVKDTYDYIRYKYNKMIDKIEDSRKPLKHVPTERKTLTNKEKKEMEKFAMRYPNHYQNYTYDQLLSLDEAAAQRKQTFIDSEWVKKYMEDLHSRMHIKSDSEEFQKQIRNVLSSSLWQSSIGEEESNLDTQLAKKVMKLSQFEKQLCTQIMETKQQARNLAKNRIHAEREFTEQREQQFHQFLDNVKEQIHLEVIEIDFEKRRQNMLHQRLYAEKMKRKRQHYYEICYETMLSIVDYATKYAHYKRLLGDDDIPEHYIREWKNLYFKMQPIFDYVDPMEELLKESGLEEEQEHEVEEIIRLELDRQEVLNDVEFLEYHNYTHPWILDLLIPNYDPESEERKIEYLGNRILGHLVYTLLEIKYPFPPPLPQSNLPPYLSKAIVRGLPDKSIAIAMQYLLKAARIHVVRLESAINHCLREFKIDMIGCTDIDLSFDKFVNAAKEEDKEFVRGLKSEDEVYSKSSDNYSGSLGPIPPNTKQTQTPKTIPEEDIKLSPAAELGKYAFEALSFGDSLTDHLLAAMIVEYIRAQDDIEGFVIINYPNSYREAKILEGTFAGREPPEEEELEDKDDIYLEESLAKHQKKERDIYKQIRTSKVVNDPHKKRVETPFESYFTCYINLHETEDILQEFVIWDLNEENSELIDRFYATLGLNYSMYYEVIEKELLATICKYVIGDLSMPLKSCDRLFGSNILSMLDFPTTDDKRTKSKIVKPEVSSTGKSKERLRSRSSINKKSKNSFNNELEVVKSPDSIVEIPDEHIRIAEEAQGEDHESKSGTSEEIKILAGEEDWDYGEIPIIEGIGVALATCWEEVEKSYLHDIQQMFFAKRIQMNHLVPYCRFIKDKMEQIITLPSYKQDLVSKFQKEYNDFEDDWRDINVSKNEWHCRVKDLQSKLYHICDERKLFAEQQRAQLQCDNWCAEELTTMTNTYISCMQAELNRSFLTYQALHDFYFAMLKKMPASERITSKELTKIMRETEDTGSNKKSTEDKVYRQLKMAYQDMYLKDIQIDYGNNPFNMIVENNVKLAQKLIKDINDHYRSIISKEYSEISKIVIPVRKKDENSSQESVTAEEVFKTNALKCIEEWIMGINGEMYRASLRMLALQQKCSQDMKLFNDLIFKTYMLVQEDINTYYMNEITSVDRLCKYFQMAIENGRKIQETLILDEDKFIIEPNVLQYETPQSTVVEDPKEEKVGATDFKISQLARLRSQFKIVAPTGIALHQAFIFLLQDFIFFGKETCDGSLFPESWRRVDPEQIPKLVYLIYGDTAYIDWRDFLIYCLNIRFPTVDELLELRHNFRCKDPNSTELISRDDYMMENLWFEDDFDPEDRYLQLRKNLIKHFLFELFETSQNMMNYSAFLIAFCKSVDAIEGFASAISMVIGQKTCFNFDECHDVVCNFIKLKQYKDECLACALKCANIFLDKVISNVIDYCEGTTLTEVPYVEDKSKDKSKGKKQKAKKAESARAPKSMKSQSTSKMAHSAEDVKMTYICPPCQEEIPSDEKTPEREEVEEEQKPEIVPDSTLAYAVSQDVIWKVLQVCLPWHFVLGEYQEQKKVVYPDRVRDAMIRLQENTDDGSIYVSMFVKDPNICRMLHKVKRFTAFNLAQQVLKVYVR